MKYAYVSLFAFFTKKFSKICKKRLDKLRKRIYNNSRDYGTT